MTIAIVDYGAGNLTSVKRTLDSLGADAVIISEAEQIARAQKLIIPGVGHFGATAALKQSGICSAIETAIEKEKPVLGICLGMQWLCAGSTEAPELPGLGIFDVSSTHFPADVKAPHVGWNDWQIIRHSLLLRGLPKKSFLYFTHSYRLAILEHTVATCEYGGVFSAVIERGRIFGVQFHPEKSGWAGRKLLENFCELPC